MSVEYQNVDKDILDFLKVIYFGKITNLFEAASFRAYLDFNRTLRFGKIEKCEREQLRKKGSEILKSQIEGLPNKGITTQDAFDLWHKDTCSMLRQPYLDSGLEFSWGQAQKWLNMTIKYLFILGDRSIDGLFSFFHVPVDNYIIEGTKEDLKIKVSQKPWSRWNDYDNDYLSFQKELRNKIKDCDQLRWEFRYWMEKARHLKEKDS